MKAYDTLVEALNDLKRRGFTTDFNIAFDKVQCSAAGTCLNPSQFEIVEHYRFEGKNDPDDSSVLYAIAAKDSLYTIGKRNAFRNITDFNQKERQYEIETATASKIKKFN